MNANRIRPRELATNTENGRVVTNKLKKKSDMKQWERKQSFTFSLMSSLTNLSARHCRQGAIQIFNAVMPLKRKQNKWNATWFCFNPTKEFSNHENSI